MNRTLTSLLISALFAASTTVYSQNVLQTATHEPQGGQLGAAAQAFPPKALDARMAAIDAVALKASADYIIADAKSTINVEIELFGQRGVRFAEDAKITVEVKNGLLVLPEADEDKMTPANQITVKNGIATITLRAPVVQQDMVVRVTAGGAERTITIKAMPYLRDMVAAGVVEFRGYLNKTAKGGIIPPGDNDFFEKELKRTAWEFNDGKGSVGARAAFYLKGKIQGEYLLTAMYDSDKETRARAFRDIDPNGFYPVYGDSALKGVDAQSTQKFFVRLDHNRSYILYGDFSAAESSILQLGAYNRAATGVKWHLEGENVKANLFATRDSLKQVVDEYRAVGLSGPYSVSNGSGVLGTEQVDIIVRDRLQPAIILSTTRMRLYDDYEFEPFNNRIVFKSPIASVDANLNPVWIRISYEIESGGATFLVAGANVQGKIGDNVTLAASYVKDANPAGEYAIAGIAAQLKAGPVTLGAEIAKSEGVNGGTLSTETGRATKLSAAIQGGKSSLSITNLRSDATFHNNSGGIAPGREETNIKGNLALTDRFAITAEALSSEDRVSRGKRESAMLGIAADITQKLKLELGVRKARDIAPTAATTPVTCAGFNGFQFGFGVTDPATGLVTCPNGSFPTNVGNTLSGAQPNNDVTSTRLKLSYKATDRASVYVEVEAENKATSNRLFAIGGDYAITERTRIYGRLEDLASLQPSTNTMSHTKTGAIGVSSDYMQDGQIFNEYRVGGGLSSRHAENATGLRNGFNLTEGLRMTTNVEFLKVVSGGGSDAKAAGVGLEYTGSKVWKLGTRLEVRVDDNTRNMLSTISVARKLNDNWTLLAKNYYNLDKSRTSPERKVQDLAQLGFAYRPQDTNAYNILTKYEYKTEKNSYANSNGDSASHTLSAHLNWHPNRRWDTSTRLAYLSNTNTLPTGQSKWSGWLLGGRAMYDVTEKWSVGGMANYFAGDGAVQSGYGVEAGYIVAPNTLLSLGYTIRGLKDSQAVANEYKNRGFFFGLRMKFDENLFSGGNADVNRTLDRTLDRNTNGATK